MVADVPTLIREGRCALTTSFLGFKFMVLYPVIQLGMASTLGHLSCKLTNNQYIWDDMAIVLGLALTMLYTRSSKTLSKERPPNTLFSLSIVLSIVGHILLFVAFYAICLVLLYDQSWFCKRADAVDYMTAFNEYGPTAVNSTFFSPEVLTNCKVYEVYNDQIDPVEETTAGDIEQAHEIVVTWLFAHMQYFSVAAAFNLRDKFRLPFYTNYWYTGFFIASLGVNVWFLMDTSDTIDVPFQSMYIPMSFRWTMFILFAVHFVVSLIWEMLATWVVPSWRIKRAEAKKEAAKKAAYAQFTEEPVDQPTQANCAANTVTVQFRP